MNSPSSPYYVILLAILLLSSGCTAALKGPLAGLKNIGCLITADLNCLRAEYVDKPPVDQGTTPVVTPPSDEYGLKISDIQFPAQPEGFSVPVTLELQNLAGFSEGEIKGYPAKNVKTEIHVIGTFTAIQTRNLFLNLTSPRDKSLLDATQKEGFRCTSTRNPNGFTDAKCTREKQFTPEWTTTLSWGTMIEGQRDIKLFDIPSGALSPLQSKEYRAICKRESCTLKETLPFTFDASVSLIYGFQTAGTLPYRVYERNYYTDHAASIEAELNNFCETYEQAKRQTSKSEDVDPTPVLLHLSTSRCKLFENEPMRVTVKATPARKTIRFTPTDETLLLKEGCQAIIRPTDEESEARWLCPLSTKSTVSPTGETFHVRTELSYRVTEKLDYAAAVTVLR